MKADFKQIKDQEAELLLRLQNGDEEAFAVLFYAYKDKLYGFLKYFKVRCNSQRSGTRCFSENLAKQS